jgi:hypothetical protein
MKVPILNDNAAFEPPQTATPQVPGPVKGASGEYDAATMQYLGQAIAKSSAELLEWNRKEQAIAQKEIQTNFLDEYAQAADKLLNSEDGDETYGKKGFLKRAGSNALGATEQFAEAYAALRKDALDRARAQLSDRMYSQLERSINNDGYAKQMAAAEHEGRERLGLQKQKFEADQKIRTDQASYIDNTDVLRANIDSGLESIEEYAQLLGIAPESKEVYKKEFAARMLAGSAQKVLSASGAEEALEYIQGFKEEAGAAGYGKLSAEIQYQRAYGIVQNDPEKAIEELKKNYKADYIEPVRKDQLINMAERELRSRIGTINDAALQPIRKRFLELWQKKPEEANNYFLDITARRGEIAKKYGIDGARLEPALNYMESVLGDPNTEFSVINADKYAVLQQEYNAFFDKDKELDKENFTIEAASEFIDDATRTLEEGYLTGKNRQLTANRIRHIEESMAQFATEPRLRDTDPEGVTKTESVSENLRDKIRDIAKDADLGIATRKDALSAADIGAIYLDAYRMVKAKNINFNAWYGKHEAEINAIVTETKVNFIHAKYDIPKDRAYKALTEGQITESMEEARKK